MSLQHTGLYLCKVFFLVLNVSMLLLLSVNAPFL